MHLCCEIEHRDISNRKVLENDTLTLLSTWFFAKLEPTKLLAGKWKITVVNDLFSSMVFFSALTKFSWTIACRMMMKILTQSDSFEIEVHYGFRPFWKYTPCLKYYRGFHLQLSFENCDLFLNIFNNSCYLPFVYALENYIQLSDIEQLLSMFQDFLPRNPCTKPLYFKLKKTEK